MLASSEAANAMVPKHHAISVYNINLLHILWTNLMKKKD